MDVNGDEFTRRELLRRTADLAAVGGVRRVVLDDGSERGIRTLEFRTGTGLAFDVLVDRAMDIGPAEHSGRSFGWRSATGLRHPGLHDQADEDGLSWLRSFSGLLVTGGLDHVLHAATTPADHYGYPARRAVSSGLHGRVANIPASLVGSGAQWVSEDECVLWAEGEVRQAAVFAENLVLRRRIEARLGSNEIRIHDTVTNRGFDRTPHMYLYHLNLGWPLLDAGSRFLAPITRTVFESDSVAVQGTSRDVMAEPRPRFVEQVYEHELAADPHGGVWAALVNDRLPMAVVVRWNQREFPHFIQWMHLREGGYALGIEPCTNSIGGSAAAWSDGSLTWLGPDESRSYTTSIQVLTTSEEIEEALPAGTGSHPTTQG